MARAVTDVGALTAAALPGLAATSLRKAEAGAADARMRAHVITGEMRGGVHTLPLPLGGARVSGGSDHDVFEEFGTRFRPAHPWMRPSMIVAALA